MVKRLKVKKGEVSKEITENRLKTKPGKKKSQINMILCNFVRLDKKNCSNKKPDNDQLNIFLARALFKLIKSKQNENKFNIKKLIISHNKDNISQTFCIQSNNIENEIVKLFKSGEGSLSKISKEIKKPKSDISKLGKSEAECLFSSYSNEYLKYFYEKESIRKLFYYVIELLKLILAEFGTIETFNFMCCKKDEHDEKCKSLWENLLKYLSDDYLNAFYKDENSNEKFSQKEIPELNPPLKYENSIIKPSDDEIPEFSTYYELKFDSIS